MWRHAAAHRDLLNADVSGAEVAAITQAGGAQHRLLRSDRSAQPDRADRAAFGYLAIAGLVVFRSRGDFTAPTPEPGS